jgi:hypothetical protein
MRTTHILFTVGIVFSGCAGRPDGSVVTPEPPQTTTLIGPTGTVEAAKIIGVTIFPEVSEVKVGDTAKFQMHIQLSPPNGIPPKIIPPRETYTSWATDNPSVATVITSTIGGEPRSGILTARAPGEVTLTGRWGEHSATRMLRIVP